MNTVTLPNGYENDARVAYLVESLLEECEGATVIELTAMRIPTSLPEYENRDQLLAVEWADAWVAFRKGL